MADNLKYEDKRETITEILNTQKLPTVVRIYDNGTEADDCRDVYLSRISGNTQVMLQARIKVKYGHIKILNYDDNDVMEKEEEAVYVPENDMYVGKEFLMPLKYHRKIKFVHRPDRRYASISQVLSELPRYIRVDEDTVAVLSNGIGKNVIVPANTTLEVVRKFTQPHGNIRYLECSDGKTSYAFGEKDRINCTEVEDSKLRNLFELVRCKMLPKVIMFQDVSTEEILAMDTQLNSAMSMSIHGPIELMGFVDVDVIVGWVRDKERKTYKTVLIPRGLWNMMTVQRRNLRGEEEKINYIKRKYGHCNDIGFIEKSLYLMSLNQCEVTWLRNPAFYKDTLEEMQPSAHKDIQGQTIVLPTVKGKIGEKKTLFGRLLGLSNRKDTKCKHAGQEKAPEILRRHFELERRASNQHNVGTGTNYGQTNTNTDTYWSAVQGRTSEDAHDYEYLDLTALPQDKPLPNLPTTPSFPVTTQRVTASANIATETNFEQINKKPNVHIYNAHAHTAPGNKLRTIVSSEDDIYHELLQETTPLSKLAIAPSTLTTTHPVIGSASVTNQGPKYLSLPRKQEEHLFREDLTKDDFFQYTVNETAHCFKHVCLDKFANICREHRIDGRFFNGFDLEKLKKDPFNLTNLNVLKVRKLIYEGWRPKV